MRTFTLAVFVSLMAVPVSLGQGRIVIEPGPRDRRSNVDTRYLRVNAEITDGVAVTTISQSFYNPHRWPVEGKYVFPLPDGVAVGDFKMTAAGKTLHGEVLDKDQARRTDEEIVRRTRDPGLLEYLGKRLYQTSVFPIAANDTVNVEMRYSQTLTEQGGLGQFLYPLRQPGSPPPIGELMVNLKIKSTLPLTSVFCPSHPAAVSRTSDREATISYEQTNVRPDRDFAAYYQRADAQFGLSLIARRDAGEEGYFLLRLSPRVEIADEGVAAKDIVFVVDVSGSMAGDKIAQTRRALEFCVNSLRPADRFNILAFSTEVRPFRDKLVEASPDVQKSAVDFTRELQALGGTNINQALQTALANDPRDSERPYLVVFMTDGEPTVDVTDPEQIVKAVEEKNAGKARFHVLGVGTELNPRLLDKLAEITRGTGDYCTETEELELKLSAFVGRLADPLLTDMNVQVDGIKTFDVYPKTLPDLFRGNDVLVLGRYDGDGRHRVRLRGQSAKGDTELTYDAEFPKLDRGAEFLPRLWANRKVAYLLDQLRLHGENKEVVDEIVRLAKRHGIVTPYTSALILEEQMAGQPSREGVLYSFSRRRFAESPRASGASGGGGGGRGLFQDDDEDGAVAESKEMSALQAVGYVGDASDDFDQGEGGAPKPIRHVGDKTFLFDGKRYVDSAWDEKAEPKQIEAFSDAYFEMLKRHPELAPYLTLGDRVLVVFDGQVIEVTPPKAEPPKEHAP
ncbi:MAG: VWA domain-containing protein [Phycisphaerales bacterium]|nr:VWA domain-containing protein [Phycisphaerales bacterium]